MASWSLISMQLYLGHMVQNEATRGPDLWSWNFTHMCSGHISRSMPGATFQAQRILYEGLLVHKCAHLHSSPVSVADAEDWQVSWQESWLDSEFKSPEWAALS